MYEQINEINKDNVLGLRISGGISDSENAELGHLLERQANSHGRLRLLLILEDYPSTDSAESLYEDMKFVKLAQDKIERMAVVGDEAWQETWIGLFSLFGGVEAAYFEHSDRAEAAEWLTRQS